MRAATNASMNRRRRPIAALILAPLLLFAVSAFGYDGLRCQFMGVVERCCCPQAERASTQPTIDRGDCCAQFRVTVQKTPTERARVAHEVDCAPIAIVTALPVSLARAVPGAAVVTAVPPDRPPILQVKQSFLI